jgi:thioredoxin-like negative regulator of GroEL
LADKFKIEGFPTIKLVKDGQVIEYDAKPDKDRIKEFLETVLVA